MQPRFPYFLFAIMMIPSAMKSQVYVTEVHDPVLEQFQIKGVEINPAGQPVIFGDDRILLYDNGIQDDYTCEPCYSINAIAHFGDTQYIANNNGGIYQRIGDTLSELADYDANTLIADGNGNLFGNDYSNGIWRWNGSEFRTWNEENSALPSDWVYDIAVDSNGILWLATHAGLVSFNGTTFSAKSTPNQLSETFYDIAVDENNAVWVSSAYGGVGRFANNSWTTFPQTFHVVQLVQNVGILDGNEIFTSSFDNGIYHYRNNQFVNYSPSELGYDELGNSAFMTGDAAGRLWTKFDYTPLLFITNEPNAVPELTPAPIIHVFPNPVSHTAHFSVAPDQAGMTAIELYSVEGKVCMQLTLPTVHEAMLPLQHHAPGLYFAQVTDEDGNRMSTRLMIRRDE